MQRLGDHRALGIAAVVFGLAWSGASVEIAGQSRAALSGVVWDEVSNEPLAGVLLTIVEPRLDARTDENGAFSFPEVPQGESLLRVTRSGYASLVEELSVVGDEITFLQLTLAPLTATLAELLVIVDGTDPRSDPSQTLLEVEGGDPRTVADLLQGRIPGLDLRRNMGSAAGGARVQVRGVNSLSLNNEPLFYLDGIRVSSGAEGIHILESIPASWVRRIRILKGPSAQYPDVSNGVILIETRMPDRTEPER